MPSLLSFAIYMWCSMTFSIAVCVTSCIGTQYTQCWCLLIYAECQLYATCFSWMTQL